MSAFRMTLLLLIAVAIPSRPLARGQTVATSKVVTFLQSDAQPFEAIVTSATQSQVPIGIILGQKRDILCTSRRSFDIRERAPKEALENEVDGTGYIVREEGGVLLLVAPDLTSRQSDLLNFRLKGFGSSNEATMTELSAQLTGWLRMEAEHVTGFAASTMSSLGAQGIVLGKLPSATTEEIANRIVSLGSKGLWVFRVDPTTSADPSNDTIAIYSYRDDLERLKSLTCIP